MCFRLLAFLLALSSDSYLRMLRSHTISRVGNFAFGSWQLNILFLLLHKTMPRLHDSQQLGALLCTFYSCFKPVFSCLVIVSNNFITIIRITFSASVPVTAVVLKNSLRFMVVPVDRSTLNPSLAAVPACRVVNVNFRSPLGFLFKPAKRFWKKMNVLDKKPSRKLSAVLQLFRPGNRSPFCLGRTFGYAVEGCKLE